MPFMEIQIHVGKRIDGLCDFFDAHVTYFTVESAEQVTLVLQTHRQAKRETEQFFARVSAFQFPSGLFGPRTDGHVDPDVHANQIDLSKSFLHVAAGDLDIGHPEGDICLHETLPLQTLIGECTRKLSLKDRDEEFSAALCFGVNTRHEHNMVSMSYYLHEIKRL
jgi:hypothetical protein